MKTRSSLALIDARPLERRVSWFLIGLYVNEGFAF